LEYIVVSVLNGVVHGLLLFMVSAGLTLIFGMMGVLNFAHAWFYMLGAYVGFTLTRLGGFWVGLVLAPFVAGLTGVLVERYMLRRVHKYGHAHELLLTFGLAFIIEEVIKLFYGDALVSYQMPDYMRFAAFTIFETNYPFYRLFMGAVALAMQPLGVVYCNDLHQGEKLPTAAFVDAEIVRRLGYVVPPTIQHLYMDNYFRSLGEGLGTLTYLPDVVIEHMHPHAGKAEMDDGYRQVNSTDAYREGLKAYRSYCRHRLPEDLARLS